VRLRSSLWFDDPSDPGMTALYLERYLNFGMTRKELQSGRPIMGIAQTGSDLAPCNRHHLELAHRVKDGIREAGGVALEFPVQGDGRPSGTSGSPSILHASPEAAAGGGLALLRTGDRVRIDLGRRSANILISEGELRSRRENTTAPHINPSQTPWQELYRRTVGQLETGACADFATHYVDIITRHGEPRHSH
jgi:dihydroxyacid dehydratase/phosphogluconate dehydratase